MTQIHRPDALDAVLEIARDLTDSLHSENRYVRLLAAICRVVPCDAACLLKLEGDVLIPLAARGLSPAALRQHYPRGHHPRLDTLIGSLEPVRFPPDSPLPDPFDGLVAGAPGALGKVHDCMGCALVERDEVVGVLTLDAFRAGPFDSVDRRLLATLAALAGATLRTLALVSALEEKAERGTRAVREIASTWQSPLVGAAGGLAQVCHEVEVAAPSDIPLLITGETGVGKELVARLVHESSSRAGEPLVHINCAALPESLAESELFGHVAGSFTGATKARMGKFEAADSGTLFLDEIGELPLAVQAKLLRALQNGEIQRIGSDRVHRVNVRIVAATNRELLEEVRAGRFREDLYHRLAAFSIKIPALRQRRQDIPELARFFAQRSRRSLGTGPVTVSAAALAWLSQQAWPGNVRELEHAIARATLRAAHKLAPNSAICIGRDHFDAASPSSSPSTRCPSPLPLRTRLRQFQKDQVEQALDNSQGNIASAARALGLHRSNLHHLMRRLGLTPAGDAGDADEPPPRRHGGQLTADAAQRGSGPRL